MPASPSFSFPGFASNTKASFVAGAAVSATLDSLDGITSVLWQILRTDDSTAPGQYTLTPSGSLGQTVATTALTAGTAAVLRCTVNGGVDPVTGNVSATMRQEVKFFVPTALGLEVLCSGETDSSAAVPDRVSGAAGAVVPINAIIRAAGDLGDYKGSVRVATDVALPAYTAAGASATKTLTMNAVGVLTIDGVVTVLSDRVLVKNEGASHLDHGLYYVSTEGTAGVAAILTRALDANASVELSANAFVTVEEGTVNESQLFLLTTNNPIVLDTTALTWTNYGVISPLVTATLRGTVSPLGAASTVLLTDGATAGGTWTTIVDASVNAGAAIAGTKVVPDFGAQNITTTGNIATNNNAGNLRVGTTAAGGAASVGALRLASLTGIYERNIATTGDITVMRIDNSGGDRLILGDYVAANRPISVLMGATNNVQVSVGGVSSWLGTSSYLRVDVASIQFEAGAVAPSVFQQNDATVAVAADTFADHAQDATGGGASTGGDRTLRAGTGATNGVLRLKSAATTDRLTVHDSYAQVTAGERLAGYRTVAFIDTPVTVLATDRVIRCNVAAGSIVLNLPAVAVSAGMLLTVKDTGSAGAVLSITVEADGAETIDGALNDVLGGGAGTAYASRTYFCNGSTWDKIASYL